MQSFLIEHDTTEWNGGTILTIKKSQMNKKMNLFATPKSDCAIAIPEVQ